MPVPLMEDVRALLGPYHGRLRHVVESAWGEWETVRDFQAGLERGPVIYSRTVANYVFDAIARAALREFADDPRVNVRVEPQTVKFFFRGALCARFKKGGASGLGQNIPTQAALAFERAEGLLPDAPPGTGKVEIIWLPNEIGTRLEHVLVAARDGEHLLWNYEIDGSSGVAGLGAPVAPFPTRPIADTSDESLIRPKALPARRTGDG